MAAIVILDLLLVQQQIQQNPEFTAQQELDLVDAQLALLIQKRLMLGQQTHASLPENLESMAVELDLSPELLHQFWELLRSND